jgi:hypothetical protein
MFDYRTMLAFRINLLQIKAMKGVTTCCSNGVFRQRRAGANLPQDMVILFFNSSLGAFMCSLLFPRAVAATFVVSLSVAGFTPLSDGMYLKGVCFGS